MAQKKSHEVDGWLARPDPTVAIVLVYGPDRGLVSERAKLFASKTGLDLEDPFAVVKLEAAEIEADPGRLIDEACTVSMFGGKRLIWLRNAASHKGTAEALKVLSDKPPQDAIVLIEAGDLKKNAPLRTLAEGGRAAMALPCYADESRSIDQVLDQELQAANMAITLEARQLLKSQVGGDRLASRGEIQKLLLYCAGQKTIELEDVEASLGDVASVSADQVVDAMLLGRLAEMDEKMLRALSSGTAPFLFLSATMRQFQTLAVLRADMDRGGKSASSVVAGARPPVFFARRSIVENALARWTVDALAQGLDRLQQTVLLTRRRPELAVEVTRQTLLALGVQAMRRGG
ncbi:DNA polymerase III subunit delta [Aquibium carbonis]|uniref:DNA-directed DNA polymerase n=1 Tax=Aquibium carbonis TaxID=2495581 RepID=A0A3S0GBM7_9HYPH|nr:DNA polymerase III subunit delta [Aquibium carbonis]RST88144.1 DNA polymerase III subunit delta [Aquibium carbonis]